MNKITESDIKAARKLVPKLVEVMNQSPVRSIWARVFDEVLFKEAGRPRNVETSIEDFWNYLLDNATKDVGKDATFTSLPETGSGTARYH